MRLSSLSVLCLFACSKPAVRSAALHIDLGPIFAAASTAQIRVSKVGLLAIQGTLSDPQQAQAAVQTQSGAAASTTTVDPTAGDQSKSGTTDTAVTTTSNSGGSNEPVVIPTGGMDATPAREGTTTTSGSTSGGTPTTGTGDATASPQAAPANPVLGSIANGGGSASGEALSFGYYPVALDGTTATFKIAVPSGDDQTLMLIAFVSDPALGVDLPVYVGQLEHVDLKATETKHLDFTIHPAGLVRPEVLPPSTLGLTDASGVAVTAVPDLNCLAVATGDRDRAGFPKTTAARLAVGALSNLTDVQRASGAMILPVGHWNIDCFANFADHLLTLPPDRLISVDVVQGHVYAPSVPLVATSVIIGTGAGTSASSAGTGSSSGGTGTTPPIKIPRASITLNDVGTPARGTFTGGPIIVGQGVVVTNLSTADTNPDLIIATLNDDGSVNDFTGVVRVKVGSLDGVFPVGWDPFNGKGLAAAPRSIDLAVTHGLTAISNLLQISALQPDIRTFHLLLTASLLDAAGNVLRPSGAFVFTVRSDNSCQITTITTADSLTLFTLSAPTDVFIARLSATGIYTPVPETVVVAVWSGVEACSAHPAGDLLLSLTATPRGLLGLPSVLPLPVNVLGQWVLYDELSLDAKTLALAKPKVGDTQALAIAYDGAVSGTWNVTTLITGP